MTEPTDAEILELASEYWYCLDETERETEIELVRAALAKWGTPPAVAGEPVALLVRKNSWREGQWESAPPNSPSYGLSWANQRVYVYTTQQPAQAADSVLEDAARLEQIAEAIRDYHHALDMRKHGGLAESAAFSSICNTMGMHWNRGEEAARRAARKQGDE